MTVAGGDSEKVVINLATGLEDPERVTVAFLVRRRRAQTGQAGADVPQQGGGAARPPGGCRGHRLRGCPTLGGLFAQYAEGGGELLACPYCVDARKLDGDALVANVSVAGATPLWEWIGDVATVFSY
jgi:predicted peroxiredoxin